MPCRTEAQLSHEAGKIIRQGVSVGGGLPTILARGVVRQPGFLHLDARPYASIGTSRARRRVSPEVGTPRRARAPPIDDGDGLHRA